MVIEDVEWGLAELRAHHERYRLRQRYYDGEHRLRFATEKFRTTFQDLFREFALNLCPTVVDTISDRLQVTGFSDTAAEGGMNKAAEAIWADSRMDVQAGHLHTEALTKGDAYVIVWPEITSGPGGAEMTMPTIYPQLADQMALRYDPARPGRALFALKAWEQRDRYRVTLYYPDRIERYITPGKANGLPDKAGGLRPLQIGDVALGTDAESVVVHSWGVVPVFHFANNARVGSLGRSELDDAIPVQDALNKTVLDLLVGAEAQALPQRWATGIEEQIDQATGKPRTTAMTPGALLDLPEGSTAGQFAAADLRQLIAVKAEYATDMARVTGIPLHQLLLASDWPSGEALKTAEARLVKKCRDRIGAFGPVWADAMDLALRMGQQPAQGGVRTQWESPDTRVSDEELANVAILKQQAGIPRRQTWRELGYSEQQIEEMEKELADQQARDQEAAGRAFDRGAGAGA